LAGSEETVFFRSQLLQTPTHAFINQNSHIGNYHHLSHNQGQHTTHRHPHGFSLI